MTRRPQATLVPLGHARDQTRADELTGMLEEIPVNQFKTPGWTQ